MVRKDQIECPACGESVTRRDFVTTTAGAALAASTLPVLGMTRTARAAPSPKSDAESHVRQLYDSLSDDQRQVVVLPLDDPRRKKISANWSVTSAKIGSFFSKEQQEIVRAIFRGVTSQDGYERFMRQMQADWRGFDNYAVAIYGNPHDKEFEFELTGRHHTIRADGNTGNAAAFGGPIVYGHGARGNSDKNLFVYQTKQANEVFKMLDGKQREKALLPKAPKENAVQLREDVDSLPGVAGSELSQDQKQLVSDTLRAVMLPYRKEDVDEVMEIVQAGGGIDKVHVAFYQSGDLDKDEVWDVWRLEGPTLVCHFRGAPHVHAYINVAKRS